MTTNDVKPVKQVINRNPDGTFPKGVCGNPNGRPKEISITERIREIFKNEPEEFEKTVREYMKDKRSRDLMWKMIDGMPKQGIEHSGEGGNPIEVVITRLDENSNKPSTKTR